MCVYVRMCVRVYIRMYVYVYSNLKRIFNFYVVYECFLLPNHVVRILFGILVILISALEALLPFVCVSFVLVRPTPCLSIQFSVFCLLVCLTVYLCLYQCLTVPVSVPVPNCTCVCTSA